MAEAVLGIMTLYINKNKQIEDRQVYQRMITEGRRMGLEVFVFTPSDVHPTKKMLLAQDYDPVRGAWTRSWRAFPHMIYDRCRIQRSSRFEQLKRFRKQYGHLTFLNRPLRNKWTVHQALAAVPEFYPHLPSTRLFHQFSDVREMLKHNSLLYLKPINGTGGRGVLRIEPVPGKTNLYLVQGRDLQRRIIRPKRIPLEKLKSALSSWNMNNYLIQEGIPVVLGNGRVHDYRMLVQKNGQGQWEFTGGAGRVGPPRSVTSNLHGGGNAVPMQDLLRQWIPDENIRREVRSNAEKLSVAIAIHLENLYGALCELALDLAINKNGHIYVLEVNPKPAREVFSKIGEKDTYRLAIVRPLEYALWIHRNKLASAKAAGRRRRVPAR